MRIFRKLSAARQLLRQMRRRRPAPRIHVFEVALTPEGAWGKTDVGAVVAYGAPGSYIAELNIPPQLSPGQEFLVSDFPTIRIKRPLSRLHEAFSRPLFWVTQSIRVRFHWSGIQVVGSSMEEPNVFRFRLPPKPGVQDSWFLKVICESSTKPGMRYLYCSVDTVHENILAKWVGCVVRYGAALGLLALLVVVIGFRGSALADAVLLKDLVGDNASGIWSASPLLIALILYVAFWDRIRRVVEGIYRRESVPTESNLSFDGTKIFTDRGIEVV